jgi:transposase
VAKQKQEIFFKSDKPSIDLEGALLQIKEKDELLQYYEQQINWLTEQLKSLKRGQFGSRSERWESEEQMLLLNEAELESQNPDAKDDGEDDTIEVKGHIKKRGHRKALPENLHREIVKLELPESEQVNEDGIPLKVIGWEISEKLKYEPAKMSVLQYHRAKYGVDSGDYVKTAPPVPSVIPKGIATPELLAAIITAKYADGLPLYRMESIFRRQDVELSRGTMARWVVQVAKALEPIRNVLVDRFFACRYVACDETTVQVLKEDGRRAETKSWMLVRSTPAADKKIILFDYSISRSSETIRNLFAGYEGTLQTDGLSSYDCLESEKVICLGCNMHARRRFEQAAKDGAKSGKSLAAVGLNFYKKIYSLEEELKGKSPEEIKKARDEIAKPLFIETKAWVKKHLAKVPDKSKIGKAFRYFLNEYEGLTGYLDSGELNPDNGFTERAIRKFAIGRNNWMFSDTPEGADASALLYSLVVTAKVNGVNIFRALTQILTELPLAKTCEDYEQLADIILTTPDPSDKKAC